MNTSTKYKRGGSNTSSFIWDELYFHMAILSGIAGKLTHTFRPGKEKTRYPHTFDPERVVTNEVSADIMEL